MVCEFALFMLEYGSHMAKSSFGWNRPRKFSMLYIDMSVTCLSNFIAIGCVVWEKIENLFLWAEI